MILTQCSQDFSKMTAGGEAPSHGPEDLHLQVALEVRERQHRQSAGRCAEISLEKGNYILRASISDTLIRKIQALQEVAQRGCAVSILGGLQDLTG